jgi:chromosome partitioning protein
MYDSSNQSLENPMAAFVLAVGNQKGGVGKTTISMNVAAAFQSGGSDAALIDADPQNTSLRWATSGEQSLPMTVQSLAVAGKAVGAEIKKQSAKFDVIVVDCPGNLEDPRTEAVLKIADFCLIPMGPSPADLFSTIAMIRVVESVRRYGNPKLQSALMLNSVNGKTKMRQEILNLLREQDIGAHLLESQVAQREVYRQTFALGTTIHDCPRYLKGLKEARAEIETLVVEVTQHIANSSTKEAAHG